MATSSALVVHQSTDGNAGSHSSDLTELDLLGADDGIDGSSAPNSLQDGNIYDDLRPIESKSPTTEILLRFKSMEALNLPETEIGARFLGAKQDPYLKIILDGSGVSAQTSYIDGAGCNCKWPNEELTFQIPRAQVEEVNEIDEKLGILRREKEVASVAGKQSIALDLKKSIDSLTVERNKADMATGAVIFEVWNENAPAPDVLIGRHLMEAKEFRRMVVKQKKVSSFHENDGVIDASNMHESTDADTNEQKITLPLSRDKKGQKGVVSFNLIIEDVEEDVDEDEAGSGDVTVMIDNLEARGMVETELGAKYLGRKQDPLRRYGAVIAIMLLSRL